MSRTPRLQSPTGQPIFEDDLGDPLLLFDGAEALVRGGEIAVTLLDHQQGTEIPGTVAYLRTNLVGALALRDALNAAIDQIEPIPVSDGNPPPKHE